MIDRIGGGLKDYVPVMLRLSLAAIFIVQGAFSLTRLHGGSSTKTILIAVIEILGGLFCLIGFLTRWAACALAVLILFIIVDDHQWRIFYLREKLEIDKGKTLGSVEVMEKDIQANFERALDRTFRAMPAPPPRAFMKDVADRWREAAARVVRRRIHEPFEKVFDDRIRE